MDNDLDIRGVSYKFVPLVIQSHFGVRRCFWVFFRDTISKMLLLLQLFFFSNRKLCICFNKNVRVSTHFYLKARATLCSKEFLDRLVAEHKARSKTFKNILADHQGL